MDVKNIIILSQFSIFTVHQVVWQPEVLKIQPKQKERPCEMPIHVSLPEYYLSKCSYGFHIYTVPNTSKVCKKKSLHNCVYEPFPLIWKEQVDEFWKPFFEEAQTELMRFLFSPTNMHVTLWRNMDQAAWFIPTAFVLQEILFLLLSYSYHVYSTSNSTQNP